MHPYNWLSTGALGNGTDLDLTMIWVGMGANRLEPWVLTDYGAEGCCAV